MFTLQNTVVFSLALAAIAAALPAASTDLGGCNATPAGSATTDFGPTSTVPLTGVTQSVVAGQGGLLYDPEIVVAAVGDIIEVSFLMLNHSIAQSSFDEPCAPLTGGNGIFPGFAFPTKNGTAPNVFQFVVEDTKPLWFYCPQTTGDHCQKGMSFSVNQDFHSNKTLEHYKEAAAMTNVSVIPEINPNVGKIVPKVVSQ